MWLVGLTEGIEASMTYLLDPTPNLFRRKGMTMTQNMLVFASTIYKDRLSVEEELPSPFDMTNAKRRTYLISGFPITLNHRREVIEIGIVKTPATGVLYLLSMTQHKGFPWLDGRLFCMTEHLFT